MEPGVLKTITEPTGAGHYRSGPVDHNKSCEQIIIAANAGDLGSGFILGRIKTGALSAVAGAAISGTGAAPGNGTLSALTVDGGAPQGEWNVRFTDATHFEVLKPGGEIDGNGTIGVAYNGGINFNSAAGGTAYTEDDRIPVTVSAANASGQYRQINFAATDGTAEFGGILYQGRKGSAATQRATADVRDLVVNARLLTWPAGATADQKATAMAQATAAGVIFRY